MKQKYVELAIRTEKVITEIKGIDYRLFHASLGICTEVGELYHNKLNPTLLRDQKVNLSEELGDVFWYLAIAYDTLNLDFSETVKQNLDLGIDLDFVNPTSEFFLDNLCIRSADLLDLFKKSIIYHKQFDFDFAIDIINDCLKLVISIIILNELDINKILKTNIDKLTARYPDKFTSDKAINRDLDAEHIILSA